MLNSTEQRSEIEQRSEPASAQLATAQHDLQLIEALQRRWMVGGDDPLSDASLPSQWQPILQGQPVERKALLALALASQYHALVQEPAATLSELPQPGPLPAPAIPVLPAAYRALFSRVLAQLAPLHQPVRLLLNLLLDRGYIAHPVDWLPTNQEDDLPDVYWPWSRWVTDLQSQAAANAGARSGSTLSDSTLSEDNWDDWYPAERVTLLKAMRNTEPDQARLLIETCAAREPADKRLRIIQTLAIRLSASDADYLQQLLSDRSQKIVQQASAYLARLGQQAAAADIEKLAEAAQELADMYELGKTGVLHRRQVIKPRKLKNKQQQALRTELLERVPIHLFAQKLQITIEDLISGWPFDANRAQDNQALINSAVNTLSDQHLQMLLDTLLTQIEGSRQELAMLQTLAPRLSASHRTALLQTLMQRTSLDITCQDWLNFIDQPLTELAPKTLAKTAAWIKLLADCHDQLKAHSHLESHQLKSELLALGLLLPPATAQFTLDRLYEMGAMRTDPALDCLKLNAQLPNTDCIRKDKTDE